MTQPTPNDVLDLLRAGNERWVADRMDAPRRDQERMVEVAAGQAPFATVFTCADSRVSPELAFDQGVGDLFVVRTAGHVLDPGVTGTIHYAADVLKTPVVIVLGHSACGAVSAAYDRADVPVGVQPVLDRVGDEVLAAPDVDSAISRHVDETAAALRETMPSDVRVIGAVYDLASGVVRWMD